LVFAYGTHVKPPACLFWYYICERPDLGTGGTSYSRVVRKLV